MKQLFSYVVTIVLWIIAVVLLATGTFPWLFVALLTLHLTELLFIGYRTGRAMGKTPLNCLAMCMLFGYLWWLPLRRDMKADEYTEEDFIEDGLEPWREMPADGLAKDYVFKGGLETWNEKVEA